MFVLGVLNVRAPATAAFPPSSQPPPSMAPNMNSDGDTASLKRKREPKDETALSQKKHRRRSTSKLHDDAADTNDDILSKTVVLQQRDGDVELADASSKLPADRRSASWKVSKPMGGRMLDIDPVFSPDER